jgi:hypothetical protein
MIVGREMIVGNHGQHPDDDMDELLHHSVGAERSTEIARHPHEQHPHHLAHEEHRSGRRSREYDYRPHDSVRRREAPREAYYEEEEPPPPRRRASHDPSHGPRVVHSEPTHEKRRHFPIGFTQSQIAAGQVAEVEVKPQVLFRGERLAVAPSNARSFSIVDIKVGKGAPWRSAADGALSSSRRRPGPARRSARWAARACRCAASGRTRRVRSARRPLPPCALRH